MKIVFLTKLNRIWFEKLASLKQTFPEADFVTGPEMAENELAQAEALIAGELTTDVLKRTEKLKIVFVPYAGVDALPLSYIKEKGIRVANVHGNAKFVAERSVAMALAFYGKIIQYHDDLKRFRWHGYWASGNIEDTWDSIYGKPCAVIGTGEIGRHIARHLKAFDCEVIGYKKRPVEEKPDPFDEITLDLEAALEKSELVFITLPLTDATHGLFSQEILMGMTDKFLVNVGRGEVVDEKGLYRALEQGILRGAAIDAWYRYPGKGVTEAVPSRYPFHELPNVILSPHLAGFTYQAALLNIEQTFENISAYIKTGRPVFEVDPEVMY